MSRTSNVLVSAAVIAVVSAGALTATRANAVVPLDPVAVREAAVLAGLGSLHTVPVPQINNIGDFLNPGPGAQSMAVVLGKSLFWDTQVGSDGQACASCHFDAGADGLRSKNQVNPGLRATPSDTTFGNSAVTGVAGFPQLAPNSVLTTGDFPFHQLVEPQREDYNHRVVTRDTNDIVSSQGVFNAVFTGVIPGQLADNGTAVADPVFNVGGVNVRRNPPRNVPSVINAVFNVDNFWDGRAKNQFNGIDPFGPLDATATILVNDNVTATMSQVAKLIPNSSLASQAVGPPLSDLEMSYAGRTFPDVGKKMLATQPLKFQRVDPTDSVLGTFAQTGGQNGLTFPRYSDMVRIVFQPKYWESAKVITFNPDGTRNLNLAPGTPGSYSQMESNFSLFFGLAVQAYESTLISDRTRFDAFMEGDNNILSQDEMAGLLTFINQGTPIQAANPIFTGISQGACVGCHGSPTFSDATFTGMGAAGPIEMDPAPIMVDGTLRAGTETVLLDNGFYNIGVRPITEDVGRGADAFPGRPLSVTRQRILGLAFAPTLPPGANANARVVVDGAFKTPILRNVELTGPYFHNGGAQSLREVLDFYHRHGDFADVNVTPAGLSNIDGPLANVKLDARLNPAGADLDADQLIDFLSTLTDERVRNEMAPFDHPAIKIPDGHVGTTSAITFFGPLNPGSPVNQAEDNLITIPRVGRDGRQTIGLTPLTRFLSNGALQSAVIRLHAGWNAMSVPIKLSATEDTWGEFATLNNLNYNAAISWNGTDWQIVNLTTVLNPLDAIYVQMVNPAIGQIIPFEGVSAPPAKTLVPGWNLVGSGFLDSQMPVTDALASAFFAPNAVPSATPLWGYGQVVSPSTNTFNWNYVRGGLVIPNMILGEGYWVYMVNPAQVSGFTSTPLLFMP